MADNAKRKAENSEGARRAKGSHQQIARPHVVPYVPRVLEHLKAISESPHTVSG